MAQLYIVRHGNTFEVEETPRRIGARTDVPLTATGLAQAEALGRHFFGRVAVARAFSSPLKRTRQTAETILRRQDHPLVLETAPFLTEIDHGPDEDQPESAVLARVGRTALTLWDTEVIPPSGWDVGAAWRIAAWQEFARMVEAAHPSEAILLVTSNGAGRFAFPAFGLKTGDKLTGLKFRTGSYGLIEVGGRDRFRLLEWDKRPD